MAKRRGDLKTTFYCTNCWAEVPESATICPHCGDDIAARQARADFVDKLIAALHHPEATTPMRAAWILGELRERRAVQPLMQVFRSADNLFLMVAAVEALGKIGDPQALEMLRYSAHHPNVRLRRTAERALEEWKERD
jgi:HEAT repeat protein